MTNILTQIKIKKILSTLTVTGISLMLFASIFSAIPTSSASVLDPCLTIFGLPTFDSKNVFDSDTGDFISVFKCHFPGLDCFVNDPNVNGIEEVPKKSTVSSSCNGFGVIMLTSVEGAVLTDSVPAEWDALGFVPLTPCTEEVKGKKQQGATVYTCDAIADEGFAPFWSIFVVSVLETRESPSAGKGNPDKPDKFKPTSCEPLFKNEGAEGFVPDATFTNGFLNGDEIIDTETPFSTGLTEKIPVLVVDPNDLDCDGVPNAEDFCPDSDPINFGPIDDWGCDTTQSDN